MLHCRAVSSLLHRRSGLVTRPLPGILSCTRLESTRAASKKGNAAKGEKENKYSSTLNLPTTSFNQRANSQVREPELQKVNRIAARDTAVDKHQVIVLLYYSGGRKIKYMRPFMRATMVRISLFMMDRRTPTATCISATPSIRY